MSDLDYDTQVDAIKEQDALIPREFKKSLEKAGLAKKTIKSHLGGRDNQWYENLRYEFCHWLSNAARTWISNILNFETVFSVQAEGHSSVFLAPISLPRQTNVF